MTKKSILPAVILASLTCLSQSFSVPAPIAPPEGSTYPVSQAASKHDATQNYSPSALSEIIPAGALTNSVGDQVSQVTHLNYVQVGDQVRGTDGRLYSNFGYQALVIPNDPQANQSWVSSANLPLAWDTPRGNTSTILAIIDTGFALKHQEFTNRWYTNSGESGAATSESASKLNCTDRGLTLTKSCNLIDDDFDGIVDNEIGTTSKQNPSQRNCTGQLLALDKSCNLIDDDGNGYIDDVRGWDFANNDRSTQAGEVTPTGAGVSHGTYTAGVAAATGNNGVGIAGVDWGTTILPIQALDDTGSGSTTSVANAIEYAIARHADVISLSLGGDSDDPLLHQAVRRAIEAGIIIVAAAGNAGCDCMNYPANYPEVLAVGAADNSGQPAYFSSYGANLDILAPGVNLYTTSWTSSNQTAGYAAGISGTSLATPIVSGMLTRMLSQQPNATSDQLIAALTENANHSGLTATSPRSSTLGFGLLNAATASSRMTSAAAPIQRYTYGALSAGSAYACENNSFGTTAVYELTRGGQILFSANTLAIELAKEQGYTANLFTYGCTAQPHDAPQFARTINVLSEFRNIVPSGKF